MPENQSARIYLFTPRLATFESATAFLPQLRAVLAACDCACVLVDVEGRDGSDNKKILGLLAPVIQPAGAALLVREPMVAARTGADGAHFSAGGERFEENLKAAIGSMKPDRILGVGRVRRKHDAMIAGEADADYVMFGDPGPDGWTPPAEDTLELAAWWAEIFNASGVAYVADAGDAGRFAATGVDFIALGDALWSDTRGPAQAAADVARLLKDGPQ